MIAGYYYLLLYCDASDCRPSMTGDYWGPRKAEFTDELGPARACARKAEFTDELGPARACA